MVAAVCGTSLPHWLLAVKVVAAGMRVRITPRYGSVLVPLWLVDALCRPSLCCVASSRCIHSTGCKLNQ